MSDSELKFYGKPENLQQNLDSHIVVSLRKGREIFSQELILFENNQFLGTTKDILSQELISVELWAKELQNIR